MHVLDLAVLVIISQELFAKDVLLIVMDVQQQINAIIAIQDFTYLKELVILLVLLEQSQTMQLSNVQFVIVHAEHV